MVDQPASEWGTRPRQIALACQGGGAHTAFTAGLLCGFLEAAQEQPFEIVALSGTSGGAICALLAWYGLLLGDPREGASRLRGFWRDNEARAWWDQLLNWWVGGIRVFEKSLSRAGVAVLPEFNPYQLDQVRPFLPEPWRRGTDPARRLRQMLTAHVPFDQLPQLVRQRPRPRLLVGAADVERGTFRTFRSDAEWPEITVDALLASAALPTLLEAVTIRDPFDRVHAYWDGLFSQNPPVRDLTAGLDRDDKPDEIWVLQINPQRRQGVPRDLPAIFDRRNELSGNLSLNQELRFVKEVNKDLHPRRRAESASASLERNKPIAICRIGLPEDLAKRLDDLSKLDRDPTFIETLLRRGEEHARDFLARWRTGRVPFERYPVETLPPPWSTEQAAALQNAWAGIKAQFDAARSSAARRVAIAQADRFVSGLMDQRGYPVSAFRARRRDMALEHPELTEQYAQAHAAARQPMASAPRLTAAVRAFDALVPELLGLAAYLRAEPSHPGQPTEARATPDLAHWQRALFRPDERSDTLAYELQGSHVTAAREWHIRLGEAGGPVLLRGKPETRGVLSPADLVTASGAHNAAHFADVLEAVLAGNTCLEASTPVGVLRGQIH